MNMVQAYLSGPVVNASMRRDDFYRVVIDTLEELGIAVFAPQFLPRVAPAEVFKRDISQVRMSDFLIAEVSNPSLGVGMEIMLAIELVKPILMFHKSGSQNLSYMVMGADRKALFEYDDLEDVRAALLSINFESLMVHRCPSCGSQVAEVSEESFRCVVCRQRFVV